MVSSTNSQKCTKCLKVKPVTSFWKDISLKSGRYSKCKECYRFSKVGSRIERNCLICNKVFFVKSKQINTGGAKTCSLLCRRQWILKTIRREEQSPNWTGNNVSYDAVHAWVKKHLGRPMECENCEYPHFSYTFEWANISGEYKRDLSDWARLCRVCHMAFDNAGTKTRETLLSKDPDHYIKLGLMSAASRTNDLFPE